jgi:hypothetical protein
MAKKKPQNSTVTVAVIGAAATIIVAIIGLITVLIPRLLPDSVKITPTADLIIRFEENFQETPAAWTTGTEPRDESNHYGEIREGIYYRSMETNGNASDRWFIRTVPIPRNISEQNFCLIFEARMRESSSSAAIVIIARASNYETADESYYYIALNENGSGTVELDKPGPATISK